MRISDWSSDVCSSDLPELATSEIYYMQIRQIPVDIAAGQSQVQIVVNFNVLVNVIPDGVSPEPVVESVHPVVREGVTGIEVRLANQGTRLFTDDTALGREEGREGGVQDVVSPEGAV